MSATPVEAARALYAAGGTFEAEVLVLGALARNPNDGDLRSAALAIRRGQPLGEPARSPTLDVALVDSWIRKGMLVEALALLVAWPSDHDRERAAEWAELLGELLAPVPAHAEPVLVEMHRQLLSGGATVALAVLEDRRAEGPLPAWAERRLALLRWMLLDNAQRLDEGEAPREASTPLAEALKPALQQRSLEAALDAARAFAAKHPDDGEAREVCSALAALVDEMSSHGGVDLTGAQTVPVMGRPAAAMQLQMASLEGAASLYRRLAGGQVPIPEAKGLLHSVETVLRALEPPHDVKSFPRPSGTGFGDETASAPGRARAMAASPGARSGRGDGGFGDEETTRVVGDGEMPLAAFGDEQTREVSLPDELVQADEEEPAGAPEPLGEGGHVDEGALWDTDRSAMADAVAAVRREDAFEGDEPPAGGLAPLSGEMTMVDVDVELSPERTDPRARIGDVAPLADERTEASAARPVGRQGDVLIAPIVTVGDRKASS